MKSKSLPLKRGNSSNDAPAKEPRKAFSKEFKQNAVARMLHADQSVTDLSLELGIRRNQLYKWQATLDAAGSDASFNGPGRPAGSEDSEIAKMKRELENAKLEIAILKKFNACLAQLKK